MTELTSPAAHSGFSSWLAARLDCPGLEIVSARAPTGGGWSSETWLMTIREAARPLSPARKVVLRLAPVGPAMFPDYDLARQVSCMRALRDVPDCPVPEILADDLGGAVLGRAFYVMDFAPGDIPSDDKPTMFEAGFLFDASAEDQRRFHLSVLGALAALHRVKPAADLADRLSRSGDHGAALARELAWLRHVFDWGRGPAPQPVIEHALEWLSAELPDDRQAVLVWGDARPANIVVRDFRPVALLDWELAGLGPPELDVFWLLEMNHMRSRGRLLPGFLSDSDSRSHYEALAGQRLRDEPWHIRFAAAKVAVLMLRHLLVRVAHGDLTADHPVLTDNIATRRLRALMEGRDS